MTKTCITCGMPLEGEHEKDIGIEVAEGLVCKYDSENGRIKSGEEVFKGGVNFFLSLTGSDQELAERFTRRNMKSLPFWQSRPFGMLEGAVATDAEHYAMMAKLK